MPVVSLGCPGHNPQKLVVSLDRYPTLDSFQAVLPARFNLTPETKGTLSYAGDNDLFYDLWDDEGWMIALTEMEGQSKANLIWNAHIPTLPTSLKRGRSALHDKDGMDMLSQLLAAPESHTGSRQKRRRRSEKAINTDGSSQPMKRQQQQTELYRRLSKEQGHIAAFNSLDKAWQERFFILADIVKDIFGAAYYLQNPLEIACPLCLANIKLSQICERRMGNLMHSQHHLRKMHYESSVEIIRETARTLVARWEERFSLAKTCVTPITDDMQRCLQDILATRELTTLTTIFKRDPLDDNKSDTQELDNAVAIHHHLMTLGAQDLTSRVLADHSPHPHHTEADQLLVSVTHPANVSLHSTAISIPQEMLMMASFKPEE
ncbi:hypothetical protein BC832DRAFT_590191 [Gaertneriomyces semiglobifer]|nr:hypothetical protein BC832DRAFT_590191 [Gaertneriomyces semiglobifer]